MQTEMTEWGQKQGTYQIAQLSTLTDTKNQLNLTNVNHESQKKKICEACLLKSYCPMFPKHTLKTLNDGFQYLTRRLDHSRRVLTFGNLQDGVAGRVKRMFSENRGQITD